MAPAPIAPGELDAVVRMIAAEQVRPERHITYLGTAPTGIRAELDALVPPWTETARVVRSSDGSVIGTVLIEWDLELQRAWIYGPWAVDGDGWTLYADELFDAAVAQRPAGIVDVEVAGDLANTRLETLAEQRGLKPSEINHALVVDGTTVGKWPTPAPEGLRPARPDDLDGIRRLHDLEFPNTYFGAEELIARATTDEHIVFVTSANGAIVGYAAGQIHPDGEGYIDFLTVDSAVRATGLGRSLVITLTRGLLGRATRPQVSLNVDDRRIAARSLYASLGFRVDVSYRGYRGRVA